MDVIDFPGLSWLIPITEGSQVADARRQLTAIATQLGFSQEVCGRVAIVGTEMATNIRVHALTGHLVCRTLDGNGLEVIAVDRGPGLHNVEECLRDGFSTNGTAGNGLGAMRRLSDRFDLFSTLGKGTVVLSQIYRNKPETEVTGIGAICIPIEGETYCGDCWAVHASSDHIRAIVVDGLGHGPDAAKASIAAIRTCEQNTNHNPAEVIAAVHGAIASTRGAAMAVCNIDRGSRRAVFCGIGNISGTIIHGPNSQRSMISHNGIVGHHIHKFQEFSYNWSPGSVLILHSDGLLSRWSLESYPGLMQRHAAIIAAVLHRDFRRGRDDVCVVVVKDQP